ncbi:MAG: transposase family protein, partial [Myxococcales bacterium]|nr:transposase family protein [Myxococcales bacterium]
MNDGLFAAVDGSMLGRRTFRQMPRVNQSKKLEQDNEQQALEFFEHLLSQLQDPRRLQGQRYPLRLVVIVALMAMICGCDDAESME